MNTYLLIAIGGAIGAMARYRISTFMGQFSNSPFPLGTFSVNLLGCFLLGLLFVAFTEKAVMAEPWRALLAVGLLGAMTTFSAFSLEALLLFQQGHYNTAFLYLFSSMLACLAATWAGIRLATVLS